MALVHITVFKIRNKAQAGSVMPVPLSKPEAADTITSGAASQKSEISASPAGENGASSRFWCVVSTGNIWVKFGTDPVAGADGGWFVPAGVPMFFSVTTDAELIAVKDA